jgi:hypothetical protein
MGKLMQKFKETFKNADATERVLIEETLIRLHDASSGMSEIKGIRVHLITISHCLTKTYVDALNCFDILIIELSITLTCTPLGDGEKTADKEKAIMNVRIQLEEISKK